MNREKKAEGKIRVIIVMMMMVMMGCNSGGVAEGEEGKNKFLQSLVNVSEEFLNVFTSFGEMVGSVLGLNVNSKKSDVGKYFKTVQGTVKGVKTGLNKIVAEMKEEKNPNLEATESVVKKLVSETLDKIITGAKTASEAIGNVSDLVGDVATDAGVAAGAEVNKLIEGIKGIVEVVLKEGDANAGTDKKAEDGSTSRTNNTGASKLFASDNAGDAANAKKAATDAAKAVGAVSGADILQAIIKDNKIVQLATNAANNADAAANARDAVIAGGILLRAIAKGGKFANTSDAASKADVVAAIKGAAVSAVIKTLDTLTIAIRKTMDAGLKEVKEAMKINANNISVASYKGISGGQN
ncbi:Variable outer membrane protein [Borrelia duttonii CR2A]|uniref:Variable large protein n=1 Tax=Borrelia duttonii CR2A TaxID=1432657 RepID=W6TFQ1_9SPIR|nr:variable large family protein [Borrelia duttonii]ETZ17622.1 Variable outer membrane protein [Borrelia duttonii CR2A]